MKPRRITPRSRCFTTSLLVAVFALTLDVCASAQSVTGRISGSVRDASKAVVPGATVTVTNEATQIARAATTDTAGFYVVTNLPPGQYTVAVELGGFATFVTSGNVLVTDGRLTVDAALEAGQVTETVSVVAGAGETVNTTSGEIARVVDGQQVQNLALNGRNFLQLATLVPGTPLLDFDAIAQTTGGGGNISVNGSRNDSNNLTVDGGFNLLKANNNAPGNNVGVDFIQEVKIHTSNFSAEHGRQSGAAINVTTRSGGNQLFGSVFEFLRNDALDARNFFAPACASCASTTSATASAAPSSGTSSSSSAGRSGNTSAARSIRRGAPCRRWHLRGDLLEGVGRVPGDRSFHLRSDARENGAGEAT